MAVVSERERAAEQYAVEEGEEVGRVAGDAERGQDDGRLHGTTGWRGSESEVKETMDAI
jgi:hypothetical protein